MFHVKQIVRIIAAALLASAAQAQNVFTTNWVEMLPENHVIEATDTDGKREVFRSALPAHDASMGALLRARVQILANYGNDPQFRTPFEYSVEQLGNSPVAGYNGSYGSITYVAVGGQICGGLGAWIGMCGGTNLTAFDGQCDGQGLSGHTTGNQVGEWAQGAEYIAPNIPPLFTNGGLNGSGYVPVAVMLTAQGFFSEWNANGHYFKRFRTKTSLDGERFLSLKVRIVYETL